MAKVEVQVEQWQERGIQVLVLLSFVLQLVLLVLAEFRRRIDSGVLKAVIWSAYMMADSVAIYTLGHLSVTSRSNSHELMAFWAPFLLLHLGGQDNITAYAIEDNQLWLRHLQALAMQVAAAAYVLYESTLISTQARLRNASILMFVLGVVKYGERVWALKRANTSALGNKYQSLDRRICSLKGPPIYWWGREELIRIAYLLLDVPRDLLQGPLPKVVVHLNGNNDDVPEYELYEVIEIQLSLMHDVMYSKAEVVHTWYGLCIRVVSSVFTAGAFMLFHRSSLSAGDHYSKADVVITYILLGGAVTLEMQSVLNAMFSRWSSAVLWKLAYGAEGQEMYVWSLLARAIVFLRTFGPRFIIQMRNWLRHSLLLYFFAGRLRHPIWKGETATDKMEREGSRGFWSESMGQHNLIDLCVRSRASLSSKIAGWMRVEDWWNTLFYSGSIPISRTMKALVLKQVVNSTPGNGEGYYHDKLMEEGQFHIINSRGRAALRDCGMYDRLRKFMDMELDESILVWHIATEIYLRWHKDQGQAVDNEDGLADAAEAISNYMLFLLAARPYMLPGSVSRPMYVDMCYCLTGLKYNTAQELTSLLTSESVRLENIKDEKKRRRIQENRTLQLAEELARELVSKESGTPASLKMLAEVWVEMLCYAGYKCRGYSHAKQLSNGGEFLTVTALVVEYYRRNVLKRPKTEPLSEVSSTSASASAFPRVIVDEPRSLACPIDEISEV